MFSAASAALGMQMSCLTSSNIPFYSLHNQHLCILSNHILLNNVSVSLCLAYEKGHGYTEGLIFLVLLPDLNLCHLIMLLSELAGVTLSL